MVPIAGAVGAIQHMSRAAALKPYKNPSDEAAGQASWHTPKKLGGHIVAMGGCVLLGLP